MWWCCVCDRRKYGFVCSGVVVGWLVGGFCGSLGLGSLVYFWCCFSGWWSCIGFGFFLVWYVVCG